MRCSKTLIIILCLGVYTLISLPAYCFYRDDLDHNETIKEIEKQRQRSKERFEENQNKKQSGQREKVKKQTLIVQQKIPDRAKAEPQSGTVFFWLVFIFTGGLWGYIYYLYKKK